MVGNPFVNADGAVIVELQEVQACNVGAYVLWLQGQRIDGRVVNERTVDS